MTRRSELERAGYTGLCSPECGCGIDDLAPLERCRPDECQPGYQHYDPVEVGFWVVLPSKTPPTDDEWERYRQHEKNF